MPSRRLCGHPIGKRSRCGSEQQMGQPPSRCRFSERRTVDCESPTTMSQKPGDGCRCSPAISASCRSSLFNPLLTAGLRWERLQLRSQCNHQPLRLIWRRIPKRKTATSLSYLPNLTMWSTRSTHLESFSEHRDRWNCSSVRRLPLIVDSPLSKQAGTNRTVSRSSIEWS